MPWKIYPNDLASKILDAKAKVEELKKNNGSSNETGLPNREVEELMEGQKALREKITRLEEEAKTGGG